MKKTLIRCTALLLLLLLLPSAALCAPIALTIDEYPIVDGSTATLPLSYTLMSYVTGASDADAQNAIRHSKTTESFYALVDGRADLLLVYAPSDDAFDYAKERDVSLDIAPIGRDALVFLLGGQNPVSSLTKEQLVSIYTGETTNWAQVGGSDMAIIPYQRVENSGSQVMMRAQLMKGVPMMDAPTALRPAEMGQLVDAVASYTDAPGAIGYSVYYYVKNMYQNEALKLLQVGGVAPSNESISSGAYPFAQDFFAVVRSGDGADSPQRRLYDFLLTNEGTSLIEEAGYVPIAAGE